jgi:hypothetical protein
MLKTRRLRAPSAISPIVGVFSSRMGQIEAWDLSFPELVKGFPSQKPKQNTRSCTVCGQNWLSTENAQKISSSGARQACYVPRP